MHPPFVFTDHKVGHAPVHPAPVPRRSQPARLDLRPVTANWPPVPLMPPPGPPAGPHLFVVPQPGTRIRDIMGRWLIRLGQRMIMTNRPG